MVIPPPSPKPACSNFLRKVNTWVSTDLGPPLNGAPFSGGPRSVDTQVLTLRRKLEQAGLGEGGGITTVRQQGYRFSIDNI